MASAGKTLVELFGLGVVAGQYQRRHAGVAGFLRQLADQQQRLLAALVEGHAVAGGELARLLAAAAKAGDVLLVLVEPVDPVLPVAISNVHRTVGTDRYRTAFAREPYGSGVVGPSGDAFWLASPTRIFRWSRDSTRAYAIPTSLERAPDALYFIGQSFAAENPDSAAAYYRQVVDKHPTSPRAASALYNLGLLAERRKDTAGARDAYQRVAEKYPQSDEAALARDRLKALGR